MNIDYITLTEKESQTLINKFMNTFIDPAVYALHCKRLNKFIKTHNVKDQGHKPLLWDCLKDNRNGELECRIETACGYLKEKNDILIMWNKSHSPSIIEQQVPENILISVNAAKAADLIKYEWETYTPDNFLPLDIYCFDKNMDWLVAFTHEFWDSYTAPEKGLGEDEAVRICYIKR